MKTMIYFLAASAMMLSACSSEDNTVVNNGPVEAQITANIGGPLTRAADQTWTASDAIGVRVTGVNGTTEGITSTMQTLYQNVKYVTSAGSTPATFAPAATGQGIFFQDANETVTFSAYYPYVASADAKTLPGTDGVITGVDTQDQTTQAKQEACDYLFASGATASKSAPTVSFSGDYNLFKHKMARLQLKIKTSTDNGFTAAQVTTGTYKLNGLVHTGTFNVTDGVATATGSAVNDWNITGNLYTDADNVRTYTMILYPQSLMLPLTFAATIDGQTFTNNTNIFAHSQAVATFDVQSGNSYTYTITVKKTGIVISGCTIQNWNPVDNINGDATM